MDDDDIRSLYDDDYAAAYDERFLVGKPWAAHGARFELEVLESLLDGEGRSWLDVGCGTGWFLGHFPEVLRAGLDLSPAMLRRAAAVNPGVELREGSFLDVHEDWTERWSVVSCMWFAYCYAGSVEAVDSVTANLARWTAPSGTCFVPVCDLEDLSGGVDVFHHLPETWTFGGPLWIDAFVWSWADQELGKRHAGLVAPHLGHMVERFGRYFQRVDVVRYPAFQPGWGSRKAIVAREKRAVAGAGPPAVIAEIPPPASPAPAEPPAPPMTTDGDARAGTETSPPDHHRGEHTDDRISPARPGRGWAFWERLPWFARRGVRASWRAIPLPARRRAWSAVQSVRKPQRGS